MRIQTQGSAMGQAQEVKNKVEARQGETKGHMGRVLGVSLALATVVLGALYFWFMPH
jgi:hypothetical protein